MLKLLAGELRDGDVAIYFASPRLKQAMACQDQSGRAGSEPGPVKTTVLQAAKQTVLRAFLTYFPVAKERALRTEQPVIVQCLHYGDVLVSARPVDGGRDHNERVVNVYHVGLFPL